MIKKTIRHIDSPIKVCYTYNSKAVIVVDKKYYCANCELKKIGIQPDDLENISKQERKKKKVV